MSQSRQKTKATKGKATKGKTTKGKATKKKATRKTVITREYQSPGRDFFLFWR